MKKNVWMSAVPALLLALVLAAGCKQPTVEVPADCRWHGNADGNGGTGECG